MGDFNLSLDSIYDSSEIESLFEDTDSNETVEKEDTTDNKEEKETKDNKVTEVDADSLFDDQPESVGNGDSNEGDKEVDTDANESTSPKSSTTLQNQNKWQLLSNSLREDLFPDLEEEAINKVKSAQDFADLMEAQMQAQFDERQRRIDEALNAQVEVTDIQKYENYIQQLESISEDDILDESEKGETLRKALIRDSYLLNNMSLEKANKLVEQSFKANSDIDHAKEALVNNVKLAKQQYQNMINEAKKQQEEQKKQIAKRAEDLKKSILEDDKIFKELEINKNVRQKVYDNLSKPIYKDPETKELLTAVQKYEKENPDDFLKYTSLFYTLTDGFKNLDTLVKGKVKKELSKGLKDLDNLLSNSSSTTGNLQFLTSGKNDEESIFRGYKLDI